MDDRNGAIRSWWPMATILPSASAATRLQTVFKLARSWVTMKTVSPSVACNVLMSSSNSPPRWDRDRMSVRQETRWRDRAREPAPARPASSFRRTARKETCRRPWRQADHFKLGGRNLIHQRVGKGPASRASETRRFAAPSVTRKARPVETGCPSGYRRCEDCGHGCCRYRLQRPRCGHSVSEEVR